MRPNLRSRAAWGRWVRKRHPHVHQPQSILYRAHQRGSRSELRMNGAGDDRAGKRQANENAAEDRSCEEEAHGPHDGTPDTARALMQPKRPVSSRVSSTKNYAVDKLRICSDATEKNRGLGLRGHVAIGRLASPKASLPPRLTTRCVAQLGCLGNQLRSLPAAKRSYRRPCGAPDVPSPSNEGSSGTCFSKARSSASSDIVSIFASMDGSSRPTSDAGPLATSALRLLLARQSRLAFEWNE